MSRPAVARIVGAVLAVASTLVVGACSGSSGTPRADPSNARGTTTSTAPTTTITTAPGSLRETAPSASVLGAGWVRTSTVRSVADGLAAWQAACPRIGAALVATPPQQRLRALYRQHGHDLPEIIVDTERFDSADTASKRAALYGRADYAGCLKQRATQAPLLLRGVTVEALPPQITGRALGYRLRGISGVNASTDHVVVEIVVLADAAHAQARVVTFASSGRFPLSDGARRAMLAALDRTTS